MACPYHFKFFKGCIPQILLGPFFNTWPSYRYAKKALKNSFALEFFLNLNGLDVKFCGKFELFLRIIIDLKAHD